VLPGDTIAYVRLSGVEKLKDRLILPEYLNNAEDLRKQLDAIYAAVLENSGELNPFGLPTASCKKYIAAVKSVHLAVLPPTGPDEESVWLVEMADGETAQGFINEMGDKLKEKRLERSKVYEVDIPSLKGRGDRDEVFRRIEEQIEKGKPPQPKKQSGLLLTVLEESVLVYGPETALQRILKTTADGKSASLGHSKPFRTAEHDWGAEGELFFFVSFDSLRALTKPGADKGGEGKPFAEFGSLAGSAGTNGSLNVRIYAAEHRKFPEFMVRRPVKKQFLTRIPADSVLVAAWSYDGSKNARKSLSGWLKEEIKKGDGEGVFSDPVSKLIANNLDQLEEEVVVMVNDLWVAILPVKTEMELFAAPDDKGRWGTAVFFDIEDKRQIEELKDHVFEAGNRAKLPWKVMTHKGVTIHYVDLEELGKKRGKELPAPLAAAIQTKVGYAQSDTLFVAGTVEAIKFVLDPQGPTLADVMKYDRIDKENAMQMTLQPGRLVHSTTKLGPLEGLKTMLADRIPKDSNLSLTVTFEETQATLKSNIPFATIATWIALERDEFVKAAR
jgi:hypothetical protein